MVRGPVDSSPPRAGGAPGGGSAPPRPPFEDRREMLDLLRRFAVHLETADVLDDRAGRCAAPHLAAVLRERADARRRMAERVRAELLRQGVTVVRRRPRDTGRERGGG
jgi:hypothetical protein